MLAFLASFLAFLVFASTAVAGRVSYFARYDGEGMGTQSTSKAINYDDHKTAAILDNMNSWSSGEYVATKSPRTEIVNVKAHDNRIYASKGAASDAIGAMQSIVVSNYQPPSGEKEVQF
ncbi:hypothetical protein F4678DRAFT_477672 [Xylaria arbuscula]|nr:hypothetical protein F4678DRAFT_477672 [Xylaria arbuscula]